MNSHFKPRVTWREKLEKEQMPKVVGVPLKWQKQYGTGTMLVPSPLEVDKLVRMIPRGKLVTVSAIREKLAHDFKADTCCPLTTGIFLRIVAETAEEDLRLNRLAVDQITPYWRVVREGGFLMDKFPGEGNLQQAYLEEEGLEIEILSRGKRRAKNFLKHFYSFPLNLSTEDKP